MAVVENRIFVKDVPQTATKDDLCAYFAQFGMTIDVYLPLQFGTSQHKGMCFVTYQDSTCVQLALGQPGHAIHGVNVSVEQCYSKDKGGGKGKGAPAAPGGGMPSEDRLFITKVPPEATKEEVEALFSRFGAWTDVYLPAGNFPAGHKGICFISYSDPQSAQLAISCGPHQLRGEDLVVELATPRGGSKGGGKGEVQHFQQQFQPPPPPQQFALQQQQQVPLTAAWPAAYPAVQPFNQKHAGVAPAQPAQQAWGQQQAIMHHGQGAPQQQTLSLKPGRLFLTKVPEDVGKDDLTAYFQQYGTLDDVFKPNGKTIAFVSFSDANNAHLVVQTSEHEVKLGRNVTVDLAYERPSLESKGKGKGKFRFQPYN